MSAIKRRIVSQKNIAGQSNPAKRSLSAAGRAAKKLKINTSETFDEPSTSEGKGKAVKKTVKHLKPVGKPAIDRKFQTDKEPDSKGKQSRSKKSVKTEKSELQCSWTDEDCLADLEKIPPSIAKNIINLLNEDNTIPFIARYRNDLTGGLKPDKLRKIRETYEYIKQVHEKARKLHKHLTTEKVLTPQLLSCIQSARTVEELEFIGAQFKTGGKRTLAERAKQLGLQPAAEAILEGKEVISLEGLVNPEVPDLNTVKKVRTGIQHIIADIISKTAEVHSQLDKIYASNLIDLKSEFKKGGDGTGFSKYEVYGDFLRPLHTIKPHQTLAISRGEAENKLSVKIIIPDQLWLPLRSFCRAKWLSSGLKYDLRSKLFTDSVDDAIKRLLAPLAVRRVRGRLNAEAENEALCVFGYNLRALLMTAPCSGHVVMGIDPGFRNGCKVAVVSPTGSLLGHDKIFLNDTVTARKKLKSLIWEFRCEKIALGNGCGCRETELLLSKFIIRGCFKPLNVSYTIISEQGVSIYSCSAIAAEEFPNLDSTVVGAISLARRLQNPLSELVKVEPKHLGVGMYQHDVKEKKLVSALDEVVSECVSFVGVDVNSASLYLLKRVAGLNTAKAQEIIKYRTEVCTFKRREDLKRVKGIKTQTFLQCAGFLRVTPPTARCTKHRDCENEFNPLDETCIHPESYDSAYKIMDLFGAKLEDLGSDDFVEKVKSFAFTEEALAEYCNCSGLSVSFIIDTLAKPKNFDLRSLSPGPIFRREIKTLEELTPGQTLEGVVRNVVSFGAFVDIGVGIDGLIHTSKMNNAVLQVNNRVNVEVTDVDAHNQRIKLKLLHLIEDSN